MADADKPNKKSEAPSEGKAKKSIKKELKEEPVAAETEVIDKTEEAQHYVATVKADGPVTTPEVTEATATQGKTEDAPKPRRKPSRRNFELEISEEKITQLKEAFQIFDFDRDGVIDKEDLRKSLIAMGEDSHEIDEEELDKMMSEACQPLDFDAFVMLLGYRTIELDPEEVLKDALSRWDVDGTGLIDEERLRSDLMCLGDKFTEQEVNMALEDAPVKTGIGFYGDIRMIEYGKFCHILCGLRKKTKDPTLEEYGLDLNTC